MPRSFQDYLRERHARVIYWLGQRAEADAVIGICEQWIRDLVDAGHTPHTRHDLPALPPPLGLVARLAEADFCALSDALAWQIQDGTGIEPPEAALIGHALAVAGGRAYAAYGPRDLDWIGHLVSTIDSQAWEAFADSTADALRANADQRSAFVGFLTGILKDARDEPDKVAEVLPRQASFASIVEQYSRHGAFRDVWEADRYAVLFRWSSVFEILRRFEPQRFLEMIDELPHPALVRQCLDMNRLTQSRDDVLRLLSLAGPSFDEGHWQPHGMAAILLLRLASVQLLSAANEPDDVTPTQSGSPSAESKATEELSKAVALFRQAGDGLLDVLFARADGADLGWHWLEHLVREMPRHRTGGGRPRSALKVNHIGILVSALSRRLTPRRAQEAWITDVAPLARQYRAIAVLSVVAFSGAADNLNIGAVARELLELSLFELTGTIELIHLPGAPLRTVAGASIARIPDVASWFTDTWSALRFQREKAWRRVPARVDVLANPAEIMAIWALGAIEWFATSTELSGGNPQTAAQIWLAVEAAFREARLVEPRAPHDFWSQAVARLFLWWPHAISSTPKALGNAEDVASAKAHLLGGALSPYMEISADFTAIVVSLYHAGVGATELDDAVAATGGDLLHIIGRFVETARGLKGRRLWNSEWVAALSQIESAIAEHRRISPAARPTT